MHVLGVVSLAWSPNPNMILTTDEDGVVDAWKLNETQVYNDVFVFQKDVKLH